jgi:hypothetical protein
MDAKTTIILCGGPDCLDECDRVRQCSELPDKVVVDLNGGHERFEPAGEVRDLDGEKAAIFEWCYRTTVAE